MRSTAKWIGFHLLCVGAVVAMVNLGFWQLRRLDEKRAFNAAVTAVADAPVIDLAADAEPAQYQRVRAVGTYLDRQFEVVNISQSGTGGRDQVAALQLADGTLLLVNRGFIGGNAPFPQLPEGEIEVVGRAKESAAPRRGQVADNPTQQLTEIRRVDLSVLATQFEQPLQTVYLEALEENGRPIAGLVPVAFPALDEGPHLGYAVQWFMFSGFVILGWVLAMRRSRRPRPGRKPLIPEQYL